MLHQIHLTEGRVLHPRIKRISRLDSYDGADPGGPLSHIEGEGPGTLPSLRVLGECAEVHAILVGTQIQEQR